MHIVKLLWTLWLAMAFSTLSAHEDTLIPLKDGKLEGLPEKYQSATFSLSARKIGVGKLSATIPPCIWKYFAHAKESDLQFAASWYHERSTLPYYAYISIMVPEAGTRNRIKLLLNLDTLTPIWLHRIVVESDAVWTNQEIPLDKTCVAEWAVVEKK